MKRWVIASGLLLTAVAALSGCGSSTATDRPAPSGTTATASENTFADPRSIQWVMPNQLPLTAQTKYERLTWPVYNAQLAMNRFPASWHGNNLVNTWRLPPKWAPYLLKNEKPAPEFVNGHRSFSKIPMTLYITLQGIVFLYPQTVMQSQWPSTLTVGDVPPTTIVAEFVPLKPAVQAGIIPESNGGAQSPGQPWLGGYVPTVWQKALGMTAAQIDKAIRRHGTH